MWDFYTLSIISLAIIVGLSIGWMLTLLKIGKTKEELLDISKKLQKYYNDKEMKKIRNRLMEIAVGTKPLENEDYNRLILLQLEKEIDRCPDLRFCQIIYNMSIVDESDQTDFNGNSLWVDGYNESSEETFKRINK